MSVIPGRSSPTRDYRGKLADPSRPRRLCAEDGCESVIKPTNLSGYCAAHLRNAWRNPGYRPPVSAPVDMAEARRFEVET